MAQPTGLPHSGDVLSQHSSPGSRHRQESSPEAGRTGWELCGAPWGGAWALSCLRQREGFTYPEGDVGAQQAASNGGVASRHDNVDFRERHVCQIGPDEQRSLRLQTRKMSDSQSRPGQHRNLGCPPPCQSQWVLGTPGDKAAAWREDHGVFLAEPLNFSVSLALERPPGLPRPDNTPMSSIFHGQAPHPVPHIHL